MREAQEALNRFGNQLLRGTKKQAKKGLKAGTELVVSVINDPFTRERSKSKKGQKQRGQAPSEIRPCDSASQVPSRAESMESLERIPDSKQGGGQEAHRDHAWDHRKLPRDQSLGTQDLTRRQARSGRIVGHRRTYPNQGEPGEVRPGLAEVPLEVTRELARGELLEKRAENRRSRSMSIRGVQAFEDQNLETEDEGQGGGAEDDDPADQEWIPVQRTGQVGSPLSQGGGMTHKSSKGSLAPRSRRGGSGETAKGGDRYARSRSRKGSATGPPCDGTKSAPAIEASPPRSRSPRSGMTRSGGQRGTAPPSTQGKGEKGGECCALQSHPPGPVVSRFDFQAEGPGVHTLQPRRSSWVKVRVTDPQGKVIGHKDWYKWTHLNAALHENLLNKSLSADGFDPRRNGIGPYVRIHNHYNSIVQVKAGTRLGNMRVMAWQ